MPMLAHRNYASMGYFANRMLELDRGVGDVELVPEAILDVPQNALAGGWWNIRDGDVSRKRVSF